jgi:hypothetical protein
VGGVAGAHRGDLEIDMVECQGPCEGTGERRQHNLVPKENWVDSGNIAFAVR